ncbi:MAG: sulfatase-like hydrolase/transferase [Pseudomonadota bacterium]
MARPNFLYIMTDQHRFDWLSLAGHPVVKTPNIDAIAKGGTVFRNFFVANPVCMPNRAALLTGRYTSVNSVRINGIPLSLRANTFTKRLLSDGYDTVAIGKMHQQTMAPRPLPNATQEYTRPELEAKPHYSDGDYQLETFENWTPGGANRWQLPYYGFKEVDLVTLHGDACEGHYGNWLRETAPDAEGRRRPPNQLPHDYTCPQAVRTGLTEEEYHTSYIGRAAMEYLKDPARQNAPFFAFVSFPDPHHPFNPPGRYWDMYDPDDFDVPDNFETETEIPIVTWLKEVQGTKRELHMGPNPVTRREVQEAKALTAGMITMIDDQVGEMLGALRAAGLADNTIVAFNSDHGELMGDHGLLFKGPLHYDPVIHVPMIWNDPRQTQAAETTEMASTVDIAATILAAAGVEPYHGLQGVDLAAAMQGGGTGRGAVLIEDEYHDALCYSKPPRVRTIRTDRYRMSIVIGEPGGELYDLHADPGEVTNLFDVPEFAPLRGELALQLADLMGRVVDTSPRQLTEA